MILYDYLHWVCDHKMFLQIWATFLECESKTNTTTIKNRIEDKCMGRTKILVLTISNLCYCYELFIDALTRKNELSLKS